MTARDRIQAFVDACRDRQTDQILTVATAASGGRDVTLNLSDLRDALALLDGPDEATRLHAARTVARYEIGDPTWADMIVRAYQDPTGAYQEHPEAFA